MFVSHDYSGQKPGIEDVVVLECSMFRDNGNTLNGLPKVTEILCEK
jgi:hypothetical protein